MNHPSHRQRVVEHISQAISSGELKSGERIKESYIATLLGLSRVPVREAMVELCQQGWLVAEPNKGVCVITVKSEEVAAGYTVCSILEGYIVAMSLKLYTSNDFTVLEGILDEMQQLPQNAPPHQVNNLDLHFHDRLVSLQGDPNMVRITREWINQPIHYVAMPYWNKIYDAKDCYTRHKTIYNALLTNNPQTVEGCIRNHYAESTQRINVSIRNAIMG